VFNQLQLGGTAFSSADTTVTLGGNSLSLGGTSPAIMVDATKAAFEITYDIAAPVTLLGTTQVGGAGDAKLRISGAIDGSGGLAKTSAGVLTLTGTNTYLGDTSILTGKLQAEGGNNRLPVATRLILGNNANSAEFDLNGSSQEIAGLATAAGATAVNNSVNNSSVSPATLTVNTVAASPSSFGGILKGNLGLTKTGADTLTLSGSNTYTGPTILSVGHLEIVGSGRLGNGTYAADITISSGAVLRHNSNSSQTLSGVISGAGSLVKDAGGQLTLSGANNSFSGGVTIRNGTLQSITTTTTLGSGTVTMGGSGSSGAVFLTGRDNSAPFTINAPDSGSVVIGANGSGSGFTLSGPLTLNGDLTIQTFNNPASATIRATSTLSGGIAGTGNLLLNNLGLSDNRINLTTNAINHSGTITLQGAGTGNTTISSNIGPNVTGITQDSVTSVLVLSGTNNTFAGDTTVNAGTLRITQATNPANANPGNDASTVTIAAAGATLNLTYNGTDRVGALFIGTTRMADGVYGNNNSVLPVVGIPQITGSGTLTVGNGFSFWISGSFANGQVPADKRGPNDDPDNDGIRNLIEYAIAGHDPTVPNPVVGTFSGSLLSFAKRADTTGLNCTIEESADLGISDAWDEVGSYAQNDSSTISHALTPGAAPATFLRLKVTNIP
jgi:autotransporter-associated beta strand protein